MNQRYGRLFMSMVLLLGLGLGTALGQGTPQRGGVFNWFEYADPARLDIHTESPLSVSQAIVGIYSGLLQWGPEKSLKVSPDLAKSWEASPDGTSYTFHLRRGVKWHDGEPFSSADVVHSLQRIIDPDVRSPRCGSLLRPLVKSVEAPDDVTVKVHLKFPTTIVLPALASALVANSRVTRTGSEFPARSVSVGRTSTR